MSKELTGRYGIVGSRDYIRKLNERGAFSCIIKQKEKYNYYDMVKELVSRIDKAFEEIYDDLGFRHNNQINIVRYIPSDKRKNLIAFINEISQIGDWINYSFSKKRDIISILELSSSYTRTKSGVSDYYLDKSYEILNRGGSANMSKSNGLDLIKKAINSGVNSAAGNNEKNKTFLTELLKDSGHQQKEYLQDILARYEYKNNSSSYRGKNGIELCSDYYIDYYIKFIYGKEFRRNTNFAEQTKFIIHLIYGEVSFDLDRGVSCKDYIKDENADRLLNLLKELEKLNVSVSSSMVIVKALSWYVGGDEYKIKQLQRNLNELGITGDSGRLLEDGVYGRETLSAWNNFMGKLVTGTLPTLNWINALQPNITNISLGSTEKGEKLGLSNALVLNGEQRLIHVDDPHLNSTGTFRGKRVKLDYNHLNVDKHPEGSYLYNKMRERYNHYPLTDEAYNYLKNFENVAKTVRIGGKILLVTGIALDTLELGIAVYRDLNDVDKKIGKTTVSTAARIGGRWAGAIAGAKLGAMGGAALGTAILPVVGTVIGGFAGGLVLGITGAFAGDKLAEWIVDITYVEG